MSFYVERNGGGVIVAKFANPQPGRTEKEPLADDDPEIIEYRERVSVPPPRTREMALVEVLLEKGLVTAEEIEEKQTRTLTAR